jgi:F-type H+-transporting ATPase subunit epsilon
VADKINFELVSPQRLLMSEAVDMVVVPGTEGDFGVIAEHAPLISTVRPGTITVYQGNTVSERIFVAGGFAEVTAERCTVLAEEAEPLSEIDRAVVEAHIRDLREDLDAAQSEEERHALESRIAVAQAKIEAVETPVYQ